MPCRSRRSRLGGRSICLEKFLRSHSRTDHGQLLGPIIAAKDTNYFALFVINRTAGKAVTSGNSHRPVVDTLQAISAIEGPMTDHLIAMRAGDQHQLFILAEIQLQERRDGLLLSTANLQEGPGRNLNHTPRLWPATPWFDAPLPLLLSVTKPGPA